jgi:hypothetical protein
MKIFGFELKRQEVKQDTPSFVPQEQDDGALVVAAGGSMGVYIDLDGTVRTEAELVTKYREMSLNPEVDAAIEEIVNETLSLDEESPIAINLDDLETLPERVKKAIRDEFESVIALLNINKYGYETLRRWYVDGRLYYHVLIDINNPREGIKELRYIDPRKVRKVREVGKKRVPGAIEGGEAMIPKTQNEYYIFNDKGFNYGNKAVGPSTTGLKIAKDSIIHVTSGLTDTNGTMVLSYLHKAIRSLNQLRSIEDSLVIYRLVRAPERRIWYIDVGNLPKMKAEQYVRDIMIKHKNRLNYDAGSGEIVDQRKFITMLEDFWLPRREGGRGTEVTTLPGGQTLGQIDDLLYFQKKLYQTLNVPVNRLNSDALFSIGRATEVTRDELKFYKFIVRLRTKFSALFLQILEKQLVLKGIMSIEEWQSIVNKVKFDFAKDNYFTELKDAEILQNRLNLMMTTEQGGLLGKYYSHKWARRNILRQSDQDIEEQDEQITEEQNDPRWAPQDQGAAPEQDQDDQQQDTGDDDGNDAEDAKIEQLRQAAIIKRDMEDKGPKNRTPQEDSQYRSALQLLTKNKALLDQYKISA